MKVTFFGTGTSFGVPVINCTCKCCTSKDSRDNRFRSSIKVEGQNGTIVVVDTGPEFRLQALKYGLPKLDAVFFTHSHADHVHGLDDVRIFAHVFEDPEKTTPPLDIYANKHTNADLKNRFDYVFKTTQIGGGKPSLNLIDCEPYTVKNPICVGNLRVVPVAMMHGNVHTTGWMFAEVLEPKTKLNYTFAYLTDCSFISDESVELVKNCQTVVIDALREDEHPTHLNFEGSMNYIKRMNGKNFYFIHLTHDLCHCEIPASIENLRKKLKMTDDEKQKNKKIEPSYDGLVLENV